MILPEVFSRVEYQYFDGFPGCFSLGRYSNLALMNFSPRFLLVRCPNSSGVWVSGLVSFPLLGNGQYFVESVSDLESLVDK